MKYYVVKDGAIIGETASHEAAVDMVRAHQKYETHYMVRANFSIIKGEPEEFIDYPKGGTKHEARHH